MGRLTTQTSVACIPPLPCRQSIPRAGSRSVRSMARGFIPVAPLLTEVPPNALDCDVLDPEGLRKELLGEEGERKGVGEGEEGGEVKGGGKELEGASGHLWWRLMRMTAVDWPFVLVGSAGAGACGALNPAFGLIVTTVSDGVMGVMG